MHLIIMAESHEPRPLPSPVSDEYDNVDVTNHAGDASETYNKCCCQQYSTVSCYDELGTILDTPLHEQEVHSSHES